MAGLGTQTVIERADLVTPRLPVRAPRFYPNNLLVRIWRGPGVGNCPRLLYCIGQLRIPIYFLEKTGQRA